MQRTILVTELVNEVTGEEKTIYGRYDPVKVNKGNWKITDTYKQMYVMSDKEFAKYGIKKGERL